MKHVIIVGDGMSDRPLEELEGKTPLQVAEKPNMDWIAANGRSGFLRNIPEGMGINSDVAIMSILGYDPEKHHTGRGPLEAAGIGVELGENDVAFRCNLITEEEGIIKDYSGGHVSSEEAEALMGAVKENFGGIGDFFFGVDYRHLFVLRNSEIEVEKLQSSPPHKVIGEKVEENLLRPKDLDISKTLNRAIIDSKEFLSNHPVNKKREEEGKKPANMIWLWGQGKKPHLEPISKKYGVEGAVISAVTLVKGLGAVIGMDMIDVPGATGYYDTSYENKAKFGLKALSNHDLVFIHVESPDEAGHAGDIERKIEAIENIDQYIVKEILDNLEEDFTISIMPDHPTPIGVKKHVSDPVPFSVYSTKAKKDDVEHFDEISAKEGSMGTLNGHKLMGKITE